ncbi:MAG TPA: serine hydrolase domain-containing protein [Gemmatimonadaceae bacterium]|nr:serine hydrolase domain-containing protein [Gemmatimonadaceae bacterium]
MAPNARARIIFHGASVLFAGLLCGYLTVVESGTGGAIGIVAALLATLVTRMGAQAGLKSGVVALIAALSAGRAPLYAQPAGDTRFEALASLAETRMKEYGVPGLALGILHAGTVSIRGLGVTNVEDPLPITAHTVFPIASISKTFAATAMMRLVERGKVDLRAPVRTYLPDFRVRDDGVSRDVTVWHLLTHLGGWEGQVSGPERGTETLKTFVASITDLMQVAPPGAAWSYNNAGFSIAGRVIEVVTGTSINRAMSDLVFQPLGLEHAGTTAGEFITQRFAAGHLTRDGKPALIRPFAPSTSVTAGGVGLCVTDLLAYARFHMGEGRAANGERVLMREALEQMRTPQSIKQATDDEMGIGWHLRRLGAIRTASHGGTLGGHILLLEIVPERNFAIAILTNSNVGWRVIQDVEREALKSYLGATYAPNQAIAHRGLVETLPSVEPLARQPDPAPYVGTYMRPSNSVVVRADGSRLFVQDVPNSGLGAVEMPVSFYGPDRVVVTDGPSSGQSIEFVRAPNGGVNWIRVVGRVAVRIP